jgi:hypothetical protein
MKRAVLSFIVYCGSRAEQGGSCQAMQGSYGAYMAASHSSPSSGVNSFTLPLAVTIVSDLSKEQ